MAVDESNIEKLDSGENTEKEIVVEEIAEYTADVDSKTKKKNRKISRTEEEQISKNVEKHPLLPPCNNCVLDCSVHISNCVLDCSVHTSEEHSNNCALDCSVHISEEHRSSINYEFWTLSRENRVSWVIATVDPSKLKQHRADAKGERECKVTKTYHLIDGNQENRRVCRVFYLATLGFSHDTFVKNIFKSINTKVLPSPDKRGRHDPSNKLGSEDVESIRNHILSYHPTISHYRRKHVPNRLYLSPELSITSMYKDYNSRANSKIGYITYKKEVNNMNISFVRLGTEECEDCDLLQTQHIEVAHRGENAAPNGVYIYPQLCEICLKFNKHEAAANSVRAEYEEDKQRTKLCDPGTLYVSVDMQKVVMLPRMPGYKVAIFTRRMVGFHETFSPIGRFIDQRQVGVIWNESISGRNATDVSSASIQFIRGERERRNTQEFFLSGQTIVLPRIKI